MNVVLISTYDLGRQPFGLASPAAWLRRAGCQVHSIDLSRDQLPKDAIAAADLIAFYLPMHTATRLAIPLIDRVRLINPNAMLGAYGLYAPLNEDLLRQHGVTIVLGPEAEQDLVDTAASGTPKKGMPPRLPNKGVPSQLPRLNFIQPDRSGLPSLDRYAALQMPDGSRK